MDTHRRQFMVAAGLGLAGVVGRPPALSATPDSGGAAQQDGEAVESTEEVSALEDLMREHGVLGRILVVYEAALGELRSGAQFQPAVFAQGATLVRKFVEDYHEKLEENYIFPRMEKRDQFAPLVKTLRQQHAAGRKLTDVILAVAEHGKLAAPEGRRRLVAACRAFIRMYRPHAAWEDTVLFPAVHEVVTPDELEELGEQFEHEEDRRFGEGGFARTVEQVATLGRTVGIEGLAQFTPKVRR